MIIKFLKSTNIGHKHYGKGWEAKVTRVLAKELIKSGKACKKEDWPKIVARKKRSAKKTKK